MRVLIPLAALMTALMAVPALRAQEAVADATSCQSGAFVGDLGYNGISCNCTHYFDPDNPLERRWDFRSEPTIFGVKPGGPADGKLQPGDVVVRIDGFLITTREGGRRFAQIEPGRPVRLRVRRDGHEVNVTIVPTEECVRTAPPAPAVAVAPARGVRGIVAAPRPPAAPRPDTVAVTAPVPPVPVAEPARGAIVAVGPEPSAPAPPPVYEVPRGWLGVSVSCSDCFISVSGGGNPEWHFSSPPLIESVERASPAFRAGIRGGDRLTHIDGVDITTDDGGRRFGAVAPGQRVELQYERRGRSFGTTVVAGERRRIIEEPAPEPRRPPRAEPGVAIPEGGVVVAESPQQDVVRFSGLLGDTFIQVTGGPVTVTETETEIIIRSAEITVRVRRAQERETRR